MPALEKGEKTPLNVTNKARKRVFVGLGWDPNDNPSLLDKAKAMTGGKPLEHDLDLACYIYDSQERYINHICAVSGQHTDQTGQIYHSGDNVEGIGDGDDEQISVELKDLDPAIHSIIFVASSKNSHVFGDIADAEIRLADGYSGHNFIHHILGQDEGANDTVFVFARLIKDSAAEHGWVLHYIGAYIDHLESVETRAQNLKNYL